MANRIEFSVNMTPVKSTTYTVDYTSGDVTDLSNQSHDYIEPTIGKSIGGTGTVTTAFTGVATNYVNGNAGTIDAGSKKFLVLRHTGKTYDSGLGTDDSSVEVTIKYAHTEQDGTTITDIVIAKLNKDEAIVLPHPNLTFTFAASADVAVEYAITG